MKKGGSASAVPSFSRSCVISYLVFQQKVNNVLLTDPSTIDPQQRIRGQNKLFVVIRDRLQRRKLPIRIFRRKNIADLDIETVVSPVCNKVNLCYILLSDIDGLYTDDPHKNPEARLLKVVDAIDENIYGMAKESTGSNVGTGGMATKLAAAKIATLSGTDMIIANGGDVRILQDIFENDYVGTLFTANENANFNLANYIMETIG